MTRYLTYFLKIFVVYLIFIFSSNIVAANSSNVEVSASVGVPDLANVQFNITRLKWVQFGFGTGTQPVTTLINRFADIDMNDFKKDINETYEVYPQVSLGLKSFNTFIKFFPATESLYFLLKYTTWSVNATGQVYARDKLTGVSANVGSVYVSMIQPMTGAGIGYTARFGSGFFIDGALGLMHMFTPKIGYGVGGLAGTALGLSTLDPSIHQSVEDAKAQIDTQIDSAVVNMRKNLDWLTEGLYLIPLFYVSLGWAF